jgi:hypothetical protein
MGCMLGSGSGSGSGSRSGSGSGADWPAVVAADWPAVIAHADWGSDPRKRQVAVASLARTGASPRYEVVLLEPAPDGRDGDLLEELQGCGPGQAFVGFDFTIGLPRAYAAAAGVHSFPEFLDSVGSPPWQDFERVAESPGEIGLYRPFYPRRPGGTSRSHLYAGLALSATELRRRCDGNDAETLFWTLGGKQAGKASLHGWRLLRQARARGTDIALWPFDGPLASLLGGTASFAVAEAYPREFYRYIGAPPRARWSKRRRDDRLLCVPALLDWAESLGVGWDASIRRRVTAGLHDGPAGEDEFDSVVGLLGMLSVVTGTIPAGPPPDDAAVYATEGWILGRASEGIGPVGTRCAGPPQNPQEAARN